MSSNSHLHGFGYGNLSFINSFVQEGEPPKHVVNLLLVVDQKTFDSNWGYAAISAVFKPEQQTWPDDHTAVLRLELQQPLRNAAGLIKSLARKLQKAFEKELDWYHHFGEVNTAEEICNCGHDVKDHYNEDGFCTKDGCECEYLGQPVDEWCAPQQVWFTEEPSGHRGYE